MQILEGVTLKIRHEPEGFLTEHELKPDTVKMLREDLVFIMAATLDIEPFTEVQQCDTSELRK